MVLKAAERPREEEEAVEPPRLGTVTIPVNLPASGRSGQENVKQSLPVLNRAPNCRD